MMTIVEQNALIELVRKMYGTRSMPVSQLISLVEQLQVQVSEKPVLTVESLDDAFVAISDPSFKPEFMLCNPKDLSDLAATYGLKMVTDVGGNITLVPMDAPFGSKEIAAIQKPHNDMAETTIENWESEGGRVVNDID